MSFEDKLGALKAQAAKSSDGNLSRGTRAALTKVVESLVADAMDFYRDDQEIIAALEEKALQMIVLDYLSKRDWYRRGLTEKQREVTT